MTKTFETAKVLLTDTSKTTIYTCPTGTKSLTLLVQIVNNSSSDVNASVTLYNGANIIGVLLPLQTLAAYSGASDTSKHILEADDEICAQVSSTADVFVEVSVLEGVA